MTGAITCIWRYHAFLGNSRVYSAASHPPLISLGPLQEALKNTEDKWKEAAGDFPTINSQPVKAHKQLALILLTAHKTQRTEDHHAKKHSQPQDKWRPLQRFLASTDEWWRVMGRFHSWANIKPSSWHASQHRRTSVKVTNLTCLCLCLPAWWSLDEGNTDSDSCFLMEWPRCP